MSAGLPLFVLVGLMLSAAFALRTRWEMQIDPDPQPDHRLAGFEAVKAMVVAALLFGLLGPLVGHLIVFGFTAVARTGRHLLDPTAHLFLAMFAYLLGGVPALATGALAGALRPWLGGWRGVLLMGVLAFAVTWLLWAGWTLRSPAPGISTLSRLQSLLAPAAVLGVPAGLLCGWLYQWRSGRDD